MFNEYLRYLIFSIKSRKFLANFKFFLKSVVIRDQRKCLPDELKNIEELKNLTNQPRIKKNKLKRGPPHLGSNIDRKISINLISTLYEIQYDNLWKFNPHDIEFKYSLHRFSWLLTDYEKYKKNDLGIELILYWIESRREQLNDSYSISERCANWIVFLNKLNKKKSNPIIENSILNQTKELMHNLELRGFATNNHLLNNGRLYTYAVFILIKRILLYLQKK